jgi:hypothetical protein
MHRKKPSPKSPPELLVEMIVLWGQGPDAEALHVGYVDPARGFCVGDDGDAEDPPDFVIDRAQLGCERLTVVAPPDPGAPREIGVQAGFRGGRLTFLADGTELDRVLP